MEATRCRVGGVVSATAAVCGSNGSGRGMKQTRSDGACASGIAAACGSEYVRSSIGGRGVSVSTKRASGIDSVRAIAGSVSGRNVGCVSEARVAAPMTAFSCDSVRAIRTLNASAFASFVVSKSAVRSRRRPDIVTVPRRDRNGDCAQMNGYVLRLRGERLMGVDGAGNDGAAGDIGECGDKRCSSSSIYSNIDSSIMSQQVRR